MILLPPLSTKRIVLAIAILVLLAASASGLLLYRQYAERGVSYDKNPLPAFKYSDLPALGANTFLHLEPNPTKVSTELTLLKQAGVGFIRQQFLWEEIEESGKGDFRNPRDDSDSWAKYDHIVTTATELEIEILARLDRPPRWATPGWTPQNPASMSPPHNLDDFGDFVAAVVDRYKGKVRFFQIWNEPNLYGEWGESPPDAAEYFAMLQVAATRARAANPEAVIVLAGLAPTTERGPNNLSDTLFLERLYILGAKNYFDIAASMSYGLFTGPNDIRVGERWTNFPRAVLWRELMDRYGDNSKPIWATEYGWMSLPDNWEGAPGIWGNHSPATQASWTVAGLDRARDQWPWMPTIFVWASRWPQATSPEDPTPWFRLMDRNLSPRPVFNALEERAAEGPTAGVGWHQESHPAVTSFGPWPRSYDSAASLEHWVSTGQANAKLNFQFVGDSVSLLTQHGPDMGILRIRINGKDALANHVPKTGSGITELDLYAPKAEQKTKVLLATGLGEGQHVLEITSTGRRSAYSSGGKVIVDALIVTNNRPIWPYASVALIWLSAIGLYLWQISSLIWAKIRTKQHLILLKAQLSRGPRIFSEPVSLITTVTMLSMLLLFLPDGQLASLQSVLKVTLMCCITLLGIASPGALAAVTIGAQAFHPLHVSFGSLAFSIPELLLASLAFCWLIRGFANGKFEWVPGPALWIGLYFTISALTSVAFAEHPTLASRAWRLTVLEPVLLFSLSSTWLRKEKAILIPWALGIGIALVAATALTDPWTGRGIAVGELDRARSFYGSPNNLALICERGLPLLGALALFSTSNLSKWFFRSLVFLVAIVTVATFSRAAFLAIFVASSISALCWYQIKYRKALMSVSLLLLPLIVLVVVTIPDQLGTVFRVSDSSTLTRLWLWEAAVTLLSQSPIFGIGPDNFLYLHTDHLSPEAWREPNLSHPHNIALDAWLSTGIFGAAALAASYGYLFVKLGSLKLTPPNNWLLRGVLVATAIGALHGLVDNSYFLPELAGIHWALVAFSSTIRSGTTDKPASPAD